MSEQNFFAFWIVSGFFLGLAAAALSSQDAWIMFQVFAFTSFFFYLAGHVSIALFMRYSEFAKVDFEKESFERKLDYYYDQIKRRERMIDIDETHTLEEAADATR